MGFALSAMCPSAAISKARAIRLRTSSGKPVKALVAAGSHRICRMAYVGTTANNAPLTIRLQALWWMTRSAALRRVAPPPSMA